jgi:phosphonate transport system substrate-binding protein
MKKMLFVLMVLVFTAVLGLNIVTAQDAEVDKTGWPETFIIGVYPGDNVEAAIEAQEPLRAYLEGVLGVRTVVITGTSYGAVVEAMRAGRADAFEVGPFSYVLAADVANAEAIAVGNYVTNVDTGLLPGYYSVMFTKKGSGIDSIDDLAGKSFAFTDPASTSGYLIPATDVMDAMSFDSKDQLDTFFGQLTFAGNHPASVLAVANGTVDAGATFDDNLADQVEAGIATVCGVESGDHAANIFHYAMTTDELMAIYNDCPEGDLAVFHQSPLIPQTPFAVSANLPQSFKDAVKTALLSIGSDQALVDDLGRFYVDPTTVDTSLTSIDALYDPLRLTAEKLDLDLSAR